VTAPAHIGIVACSSEGAALCYRTISLYGSERLGRHAHPEVSMHTHCLADHMEAIRRDDWQAVAEIMLSSARKLQAAGADFLICPDNTCHIAFPLVAKESPLPWLHIAEVVATEAKAKGFRRIGILGTRYTMEGPVYPEKLGALGLEYRAPRPAEIDRLDGIIFDELVNGRFTGESLRFFQQEIAALREQGCDAVILGCTEIPLLVPPEASPLPTLDSTRLLARAAVEHALDVGDPT
jgi:aspartate racemase